MKHLLHHKASLYTFILITGIIGWLISDYKITLIQKHDPFTIVFINTMISCCVLLAVVPLYFERGYTTLYENSCKLETKDIYTFIGLGLLGVCFGIIGSSLKSYHGISLYKGIRHVLGVIIGVLGVITFTRDKLTPTKKFAIVLMGIATYLLS